MKVTINGEPRELAPEATLHDAAAAVGVELGARGIAVAVDGEVVRRDRLEGFPIAAGQRIEIVRAIQGGAR